MTTRNGSRIYRGVSRPIDPEACPVCWRVISWTSTGRRRLHRDADGIDCAGSGVLHPSRKPNTPPVSDVTICLDDRWANRDRTKPANKWSGKA